MQPETRGVPSCNHQLHGKGGFGGVERFDALKCLINNAGIAAKGDVAPTDDEAFERVLAVDVAGYFHMAKAAMPQLRERRGAIVMTSSVFGLGCDRDMLAYNTSKGAMSNIVPRWR